MSATEPEDRRSRRDLLAPLGVLLVVSGVAVIVLAAITTPFVVPPGAFLVVSGIGLVVASEYRDEADLDYSRLSGLKVKVRKNAASTEGISAKVPSRLPSPARQSAFAERPRGPDEEAVGAADRPRPAGVGQDGDRGEDRSVARGQGERPPWQVIEGQGEAGSNHHRPTGRVPGGCRLAQALNKRWDGRQ